MLADAQPGPVGAIVLERCHAHFHIAADFRRLRVCAWLRGDLDVDFLSTRRTTNDDEDTHQAQYGPQLVLHNFLLIMMR
jgi:hypothetical protein